MKVERSEWVNATERSAVNNWLRAVNESKNIMLFFSSMVQVYFAI